MPSSHTLIALLLALLAMGGALTLARSGAAAVAPAAALAANIVVNSTADDTLANLAMNATCDLREAIQAANTNAMVGQCAAGMVGADTITFTVTGTIVLTAGELVISEALTINGAGAQQLTISGNNASRVFNIAAGSFDVTFNALTIANWRGDRAQQRSRHADVSPLRRSQPR